MIGVLARRIAGVRAKLARREAGFTLVELLIVIVILGVLAAIVVIAVSGITSRGETEACRTAKRALEAAEEAAFAQKGEYLYEDQLVTEGFLREESSHWNVVPTPSPSATAYSLTAQNTDCTGL